MPRGSDALLLAAVLALAAGLLVYLSGAFSVDSWLALVAGRDIWQNGLPTNETLTVVSHGVQWVDQQWLSQLATYGLYKLGGLGLVGLANVALLCGGIGGAVLSARKLGAHALTVMLLLPVCVWLILPSREIRTQEFVIPLFVATVYLLATDSRNPSRRVYWCLPMLVLWANLHGTAFLGAGLVALRGLTLLWNRRGAVRDIRQSRRPLLLIIGAPICLMLTPYALHTISYYQDTLFNSSLKNSVTEWAPVTSEPLIAWPFFVLAAAGIWSFGRAPGRTTSWDRIALLALAVLSITVIRNVLFFALCALVLMPVSLDGVIACRVRGDVKVRPRVNALALTAVTLAAAIAGIAALTRPAKRYELSYQRTGVLAAVTHATRADPTLKVIADVRFADWLLWRDPALSGRLANDARFELLKGSQMERIRRAFAALGTDWARGASGYRLVVLDRDATPEGAQAFESERGSRILYNDGRRLVILRSAQEAGS